MVEITTEGCCEGAGVSTALERHYTVGEIAKMWRFSDDKVRQLFRDAPGVIPSQPRSLRLNRKRQNITLRIPESVMVRVHDELAIKRAA